MSLSPPVRSDSFHFFKSWIAAPLRVASVTPSSRSLARLMTPQVGSETGPVIELGPGTGVFTRALLERGIDEGNLTLIEYGHEFTAMLKQRYPRARILQLDAAKLEQAAMFDGSAGRRSRLWAAAAVDVAEQDRVDRRGVFTYLRPGGALYQFTYGPRCPVPQPVLDRLNLESDARRQHACAIFHRPRSTASRKPNGPSCFRDSYMFV